MALNSIHHVLLAMPPDSEEDARAFYGNLLGLAEIQKPEHLAARGGCWFGSGDLQVHMGVDPDFRAGAKAHTAFLTDDIEALRARLVEAGARVADDEALPGFNRFYAYDPFGNRLEFLAALEAGDS